MNYDGKLTGKYADGEIGMESAKTKHNKAMSYLKYLFFQNKVRMRYAANKTDFNDFRWNEYVKSLEEWHQAYYDDCNTVKSLEKAIKTYNDNIVNILPAQIKSAKEDLKYAKLRADKINEDPRSFELIVRILEHDLKVSKKWLKKFEAKLDKTLGDKLGEK